MASTCQQIIVIKCILIISSPIFMNEQMMVVGKSVNITDAPIITKSSANPVFILIIGYWSFFCCGIFPIRFPQL